MNKTILLLPVICVLATSCTTKEIPDPKPQIPSKSVENLTSDAFEQLQKQSLNGPKGHMYRLVWGFKEVNNRYPSTSEEFIEYYGAFTNEPEASLEDFNALTFTHGENNTLIVSWEIKETPATTESMVFDLNTDKASSSFTLKM